MNHLNSCMCPMCTYRRLRTTLSLSKVGNANSGNHGHAGRPGLRGGSASKGSAGVYNNDAADVSCASIQSVTSIDPKSLKDHLRLTDKSFDIDKALKVAGIKLMESSDPAIKEHLDKYHRSAKNPNSIVLGFTDTRTRNIAILITGDSINFEKVVFHEIGHNYLMRRLAGYKGSSPLISEIGADMFSTHCVKKLGGREGTLVDMKPTSAPTFYDSAKINKVHTVADRFIQSGKPLVKLDDSYETCDVSLNIRHIQIDDIIYYVLI